MDFLICFVLSLSSSSSNINYAYVGSSFPVFQSSHALIFLLNYFSLLFSLSLSLSFFLLLFLLYKLYFPIPISDNGGLDCLRTIQRYLKNPHSGSEDIWGHDPEKHRNLRRVTEKMRIWTKLYIGSRCMEKIIVQSHARKRGICKFQLGPKRDTPVNRPSLTWLEPSSESYQSPIDV